MVRFQKKWREQNPHNSLNPLHEFPSHIVSAGKGSYGDLKIMWWNAEKEKLSIGNYVSIASNVTFLLGGNHHVNTPMTFPACKLVAGGNGSFSKGQVVIEDDVWIGYGSIILSGVTIGKGAVIGAGSVVSKDIPPYAIAVGNPVKIIKYRFSDDIIAQLKEIDYSKLNYEKAKDNINILNSNIDDVAAIDRFKELFT